MLGARSTQIAKLFGTRVSTNLEAVAIVLATGFAGQSLLEGALIVAAFAVGTGLHLASHWLVALAFGKGIDRMVLTRAGHIDYSGDGPHFFEGIVRTVAGPAMNAALAVGAFAALAIADVQVWHPDLVLAVRTFAMCNLILTAVNFLPAIPLDGGLILQMVLARVVGEATALRVAVWISVGLMLASVLLGVWLRQPVLVYLATVIGYDNWNKYLRRAPRQDEAVDPPTDGDRTAP